MEYFFFLVLVVLLLGGWILWTLRPKYLDVKTAQSYQKKIEYTRTIEPSHAVLESHKIFVLALKELGKSNLPAAKIIARHQKRFSNTKQIWEFHRLRNLLAHEIGIKVTEKDAENARMVFMKSIASLVKK